MNDSSVVSLSFKKMKKLNFAKMLDEVRNTIVPFVRMKCLFPKRARNYPVKMRITPIKWAYLFRN
jgi:hypothetical protein